MAKVKILLDTDIGGDCDDAGAMAVMHELANRGECDILAVTHCCSGPYNAGCIDAINRYFGRPDIPVGVFHPEDQVKTGWKSSYAQELAQGFENRYAQGEDCPGTVEVMRRALAQAEDDSVTLVVIGSLYSMRRLLESQPDEFSALSGPELIRKKIKTSVIMGGRFHQQWPTPIVLGENYVVDAEFNILCDVPAARVVCAQWPGELVFCSYEIGLAIHTGMRMQTEGPQESPVRAAYAVWGTKFNEVGRESWDLATMLYAIRPDAGYWSLHEFGQISTDEKGITSWKSAPERHTYLIEKVPPEEVRKVLDSLLEADMDRKQKAQAKG